MHIELAEKRYYKIGEIATAFNVNASLIRFWEKEFEVLKPRKNSKGNRLYTSNDISNLKIIYHLLKEKGFTIEGAKKKMKEKAPSTLHKNQEIIDKLESIKDELLKIKNYL